MFIFLDDEIIDADRSFIHALTPGVLKAKGVFETIRVYKNGIFGLKKHLKRMRKGLNFFNFKMPYSFEEWSAYIERLCGLNHFKEARARLMVWQEKNNLKTAIICQPLSFLKLSQYQQGFKAAIEKSRKKISKSPEIKSLDYAFFREVFLAAEDQGCDEALLVNKFGFLMEGTRANVFFVKDGILYTPAIESGCLAGITRGYVIALAKRLGIVCKTIQARVEEFCKGQEAFLTNSLMEIMPLVKMGGHNVGAGRTGPITRKLIKAYQKLVRESL